MAPPTTTTFASLSKSWIGRRLSDVALAAVNNKENALESEQQENDFPPVEEYEGRMETVFATKQRTRWSIQVDTPYGHLSKNLILVPGREREKQDDASSSSSSSSSSSMVSMLTTSVATGETEVTAEMTLEQRSRLLGIASLMLGRSKRKLKTGKKKGKQEEEEEPAVITAVYLMEQDDTDDAALRMPIFAAHSHAPLPIVEEKTEEEEEKTDENNGNQVENHATSDANEDDSNQEESDEDEDDDEEDTDDMFEYEYDDEDESSQFEGQEDENDEVGEGDDPKPKKKKKSLRKRLVKKPKKLIKKLGAKFAAARSDAADEQKKEKAHLAKKHSSRMDDHSPSRGSRDDSNQGESTGNHDEDDDEYEYEYEYEEEDEDDDGLLEGFGPRRKKKKSLRKRLVKKPKKLIKKLGAKLAGRQKEKNEPEHIIIEDEDGFH